MKINLKPVFSNGYIQVLKLEKVKDAWYDYSTITLHYPIIKIRSKNYELYDSDTQYSIALGTAISYSYNECYKSFHFKVLGFGFSVYRNYNY
jgi:hypothetical protein